MSEYKPIPIGIEDFRELISKRYHFVDKTLMIKDLIDSLGKVNLFTRPRRFGKTLNLSMMRRYFEKTDKDNSYLFDGLKISEAGEEYKEYMGQYPVINISLKSMKQPSYELSFIQFKDAVTSEFERHRDVLKSEDIPPKKRKQFEAIYNDTADDSVYLTALKLLSDCLSEVYGKNVIILIDEYDVPLQNAYFEGFYNEMIYLIRSVFESALKTNDSLEFAVLTGCLRISKESIFTGLNNLKVYHVTDNAFSEYFGFTQDEIEKTAEYYNISDKLPEMKEWYDGYLFGNTEIYNPWSILNYIKSVRAGNTVSAEPYWINTSSNDIIHDLIAKSDKQTRDDIEKIINRESIEKPVYQDITYANINVKSDSIWSFLLHTGYLKPVSIYKVGDDSYFKAVVPNTEVKTIYIRTFREWFNENIRGYDKNIFFNAVINGDPETFSIEVNRWLTKSISYHDGYENFYHGFLVGLLKYTDDYTVISNRESGTGRSDIIVKNALIRRDAVIIEIKSVRNGETLEGQCDAALRQIDEKQYVSDLLNEGYKSIIKYGIAFEGKFCMVKMAE